MKTGHAHHYPKTIVTSKDGLRYAGRRWICNEIQQTIADRMQFAHERAVRYRIFDEVPEKVRKQRKRVAMLGCNSPQVSPGSPSSA